MIDIWKKRGKNEKTGTDHVLAPQRCLRVDRGRKRGLSPISSLSFQEQETVGILVTLVRRVVPAFDLVPGALVELREPGVAVDFRLHPGQVDTHGSGQELFVQRGSSHDNDLLMAGAGSQCAFRIMEHVTAWRRVIRLPGKDDVLPSGQRPADGFMGLPAHDDGFAHGDRLEMAQITGQAPGQGAVDADHALAVHGNDE